MSELIRVLHIVTNMSYGGIENLLMSLYRNIDRSKVQFDFLTHFAGHQDFEKEISELGGRLYRFQKLNPINLSYYKQLSTFFQEHPEYKIVHTHLDCLSGIPLKVAKKCGIKVRIAHAHSSSQNRNWKYAIKSFYKRIIPKYATDLFACSNAAGDFTYSGKEYKVLNNAIDASEFSYSKEKENSVREKLGVAENFVVGHIGQFREEKNHLFLVDIFNFIQKKNPDSRLVLVGKGPILEPTKQKVADLGLSDKVLFLGARSDVSDILQCFNVFALPSKFEGLPVSVIEAQAAGLPCVVTDYVPDVCCEVTGNVERLQVCDNAEEWAACILKYKGFAKKDNCEQIKKAGFDIKENAKWLEAYYINAYEEQ